MRFSLSAALIALVAPLAFALPSAIPASTSVDHSDAELVSSVHNLTERTYGYYTSQYSDLKCDRITGTYGYVRYDFGCLCYDDIDSFCRQNGLSSSVNYWLKKQFGWDVPYRRYPIGSQPTCDSRVYTCPNGKDANGYCAAKDASCGDGQCLQKDGSCCPRGTTKINGLCCAQTCSGTSNGRCYGFGSCPSGKVLSNELCCQSGWTGYDTVCCPSGQMEDPQKPGTCKCSNDNQALVNGVCTNRCNTGYSWCQTKCCPNHMSLINGECACPAGQVENSSKNGCVAKCTTQQTFVPETNTCQNKCGSGYTWSSSSSNPTGLCCTGGRICQTKICCLPGETEVNGKCVAPSPKPVAPKRRSLNNKRALTLAEKTRLRVDEKLCPKNLSACPISASDLSSYECLDSFTDISSCGGCASLGEGQDCTAIKGAKWMGCEQGSCVVYSCRPGFKLVDGKTCVKA